jgi:hypothetical protein
MLAKILVKFACAWNRNIIPSSQATSHLQISGEKVEEKKETIQNAKPSTVQPTSKDANR